MSQFTKMLEPSPPKNYEQTESGRSILLPVAFPAKMYHAPALEKALKTAMDKLLGQGCGENTQELLANLDQNGLWLRMCEGCCQQVLISDREETLELFSGTWPTWGLMRSGRVTVLKPLVRRTKGKESLSWPTARANKIGARGPKSAEMYEECKKTNKHALNLLDQVKHECNWPTPNVCGNYNRKGASKTSGNGLATAVKNWPTPTVADIFTGSLKSSQQKPGSMHSENLSQCVNCPTPTKSDYKGAGPTNIFTNSKGKSYDRTFMRLDYSVYATDNKGQLNADWVEILMGLPINWTNAEISNGELKQWPGWPAPMNATRQWATPNTMDMLPSRSYEAMKNQATNGARKNRTGPGNLREQIDPLMRKAYVEASKENGGKLNEEVSISGQYSYEPPRVIEGQKNRAKRLKCLGNGCCPLQVYPIFKAIVEMESKEEALKFGRRQLEVEILEGGM